MPKPLDSSMLEGFAPKRRQPASDERVSPLPEKDMRENTVKNAWPSREISQDGQFTVRAPMHVIERFKAMCKDDRRTYAAMLEILMDNMSER